MTYEDRVKSVELPAGWLERQVMSVTSTFKCFRCGSELNTACQCPYCHPASEPNHHAYGKQTSPMDEIAFLRDRVAKLEAQVHAKSTGAKLRELDREAHLVFLILEELLRNWEFSPLYAKAVEVIAKWDSTVKPLIDEIEKTNM